MVYDFVVYNFPVFLVLQTFVVNSKLVEKGSWLLWTFPKKKPVWTHLSRRLWTTRVSLLWKRNLICSIERKWVFYFCPPLWKFVLHTAAGACLRHGLEAALANWQMAKRMMMSVTGSDTGAFRVGSCDFKPAFWFCLFQIQSMSNAEQQPKSPAHLGRHTRQCCFIVVWGAAAAYLGRGRSICLSS